MRVPRQAGSLGAEGRCRAFTPLAAFLRSVKQRDFSRSPGCTGAFTETGIQGAQWCILSDWKGLDCVFSVPLMPFIGYSDLDSLSTASFSVPEVFVARF